MMTEWEEKADALKTYAHAVTYFNGKMVSIERYEDNSGSTAKKNGFKSANATVEIAESLKGMLEGHLDARSNDLEETKSEHMLQMSSLRKLNQEEMETMQSQMLMVTRAFTALSN